MMRHVESLFQQSKLKSTVSFGPGQCTAAVFWKLNTVSGLNLFLSFFHWSLKNTANGKEACWGDQVQVCLTVTYDKLFHHRLQSSSSVRLGFSFFISLILNLTRVKSWKDEINTQVLSFFLIFLEIKRFKAAKWALAFEILVHTVSYGLQIDQSQDKIRLSHIINKVIWNFLNTQKMLVFP